jgi:hypothetical protein
VPRAGLGERLGADDGLGDGVAGEVIGLVSLGAVVAGAAEIVVGLASPAGMAQPATSEAISAMANVRTPNRCRGRVNSQRRAG